MRTWVRFEDGQKVRYQESTDGQIWKMVYDPVLLMWRNKEPMHNAPEDAELIDELVRSDEIRLE